MAEPQGLRLTNRGYLVHRLETGGPRVLVHRTVVEKVLGRPLKAGEIIHHLDYNKTNNDPANLVVCPDQAYHKLLHVRTDALNAGFHPDLHSLCSECKTYHFKEAFPKSVNQTNGLHNICREETNRKRRGKGYNKFGFIERLKQQYRRAKEKAAMISWLPV